MSNSNTQDLSGVTLLGNQNTKYVFDYDPSILEKFERKFEESTEDEQIVSLDCFEFCSRCLTGDTLIEVARDESKNPKGIPIRELVGTTGYVFGFDPISDSVQCRRYFDVRKTGTNCPIVKVKLEHFSVSNGRTYIQSELRCTPDHLILVRTHWHTYEWIKAKDLKPGMHLVYSQTERDHIRGKNKYRLIAEQIYGTSLENHSELDVHHRDSNHSNNSPDNLEIKPKGAHYHDHQSERYGYDDSLDVDELVKLFNSGISIQELSRMYKCDNGTIKDRLKGKVEFRSQAESLRLNYIREYTQRDIEICELYQRGYTSYEIGDYFDLHDTTVLQILRRYNVPIRGANDLRKWRKANVLPPLNHRVVSVEDDGFEDVYNMEVSDIHNFFANDVVVHNCPKTGQPDFATIHISYIPNKYMVESKSLKLYLFSFQQHGDFHESCVHAIMQDLVDLLDPKYLEVYGDFNSRGGISILPLSIYADDAHKDMKKARQLAVMQHNISHRPRTS